jgi:hypothetical protein
MFNQLTGNKLVLLLKGNLYLTPISSNVSPIEVLVIHLNQVLQKGQDTSLLMV